MGSFLNPVDDSLCWDEELAYERARAFKSQFGDSFFPKIQCATEEGQGENNKRIIEMGKNPDIPVYVTEFCLHATAPSFSGKFFTNRDSRDGRREFSVNSSGER